VNRIIKPKIEQSLFKRKIIIIYGPRQVGKTTLIKEIQKKYFDSMYFNCDEPDIRDAFTNRTSTELKSYLGNKKLIFIDEAQRVKNIGITLKLIIDNYPEIQIVATGSSSFELSNKIAEPLTGRKIEFFLPPFSIEELGQIYTEQELNRLLNERIVYGMYPEVVLNRPEARENLKNISLSYAYKDVLEYQNIKYPDMLQKLLQALALQIGNEVSYNELASTIGIDKNTIMSYVSILEKAFIIFRLNPFSRNLRTELKKLRKIYFYDTGIRNALINNYNPLNLRTDIGAMWENFIISERQKLNNNHGIQINSYFWRTRQRQEIDYLEEKNNQLSAFEIKYKKEKFTAPKSFLISYPDATVKLINKNNYREFTI